MIMIISYVKKLTMSNLNSAVEVLSSMRLSIISDNIDHLQGHHDEHNWNNEHKDETQYYWTKNE